MKTIAIIQARMSSTRLPGKVLMPLLGEPMLARVVNRVRRAIVDDVVVATTDGESDQVLADLCASRGWPCFRGSLNDVLDRYYRAAQNHRADIIVRVTSDCPLIEPAIIDDVVRKFQESQDSVDYAANVLPPRTFPRGLDVETFSFETLETAWRDDDNPAWREHVTPFIYRHPDRFRLLRVAAEADYSNFRWTVDTPEDWDLTTRIYEAFGHDRFTWKDVLSLMMRRADLVELNRHIMQKAV